MKNRKYLMLQMFAEEPTGNEPTTEPTTEPGVKSQPDGKANGAGAKSNEPTQKAAKYTDDDVNRLIDQKFAEWQKKKDAEINEAKKLAEMNEAQKAKYEKEKLQKELDSYKKQSTLIEMTKTARGMLAESSITVPDELLVMLVSDDADETKKAVDGFAKAFSDAVEAEVKNRLKGNPPKQGTGGTVTMPREKIMEIADPELRQQKMLENRTLFNF